MSITNTTIARSNSNSPTTRDLASLITSQSGGKSKLKSQAGKQKRNKISRASSRSNLQHKIRGSRSEGLNNEEESYSPQQRGTMQGESDLTNIDTPS